MERIPDNYIKLEGETDNKNMQKLLDMLEDNDDVQNVYHNWEETEQGVSFFSERHLAFAVAMCYNVFCY